MLIHLITIPVSLIVLIWSADKFVDGSAEIARKFGVPPLLIGMVIIGFGTSAPEMVVSSISACQGNPGIAIGNAYGSNIANIALILGLTALLSPIIVKSTVLKKELPLLCIATALAAYQLFDGVLSRMDAIVLLAVFAALMTWTITISFIKKEDSFGEEVEQTFSPDQISAKKAFFCLLTGLVFLVISSRALVWGAVEIANGLGVSDVIIGLTIVAIGTSLPELASSLVASKKGENDIALGNVIGSNLFNTLAVTGIAGVIHPLGIDQSVLHRDMLIMGILTLSLFFFGFGMRGKGGRINRWEGGALFIFYLLYTSYLVYQAITTAT